MNYLAPGLRELARIFDRLMCRVRLLVSAPAELARLESSLGLLGWQQADYDTETQQHVDRLTEHERSQARLTNESATIGLQIHELEEGHKAEAAAYEQEHAVRANACAALAVPVQEKEPALADVKRAQAELDRQLAALEKELAGVEAKYRSLLAAGTPSPAVEEKIRALQQRVIAIPGEKKQAQAALAEVLTRIPPLEVELEQGRAFLSVESEALARLEKTFAEVEKLFAAQVAARKKEKLHIERQIDAVEKAKAQPYREIGRALADQRIEPANQPEALTLVLAQRERIAVQEARLAASLEASAREDRRRVWNAWGLLLIFAALAALLAVVGWLLVRGH